MEVENQQGIKKWRHNKRRPWLIFNPYKGKVCKVSRIDFKYFDFEEESTDVFFKDLVFWRMHES